jgi:hypothetical protein
MRIAYRGGQSLQKATLRLFVWFLEILLSYALLHCYWQFELNGIREWYIIIGRSMCIWSNMLRWYISVGHVQLTDNLIVLQLLSNILKDMLSLCDRLTHDISPWLTVCVCVCVCACVRRGHTFGICSGNSLFGCVEHKVIIVCVLYKFPAMCGSFVRSLVFDMTHCLNFC